LPKTNSVYENAALLWRSAKAIFTAGKIVSCTSETCGAMESGEIRALVEAAYSEEIIALPPSLEPAETKAQGNHYGEVTIARGNVLNIEKGYDWDGIKWERDTRIKTRLGEDTITLRLARIEDGKIIPWAPVEAEDWRRAWALSEVSLRQSQCLGSDNPLDVEALVEQAKRGWTISEKEIPVIVLRPADEGEIWQGRILEKREKSIKIRYSITKGFEICMLESSSP